MRSDAQSFIQSGLEDLKGWRLCSLPEQPVSLLTVFMVKNFLLISALNLSCFSLCPLLSSCNSPLWRAELHLLHGLLLGIRRLLPGAPKALSSSDWTSPVPLPPLTGQLLQLPHHLGCPLLHLLQFKNPSCIGGPKTGPVHLVSLQWTSLKSIVQFPPLWSPSLQCFLL